MSLEIEIKCTTHEAKCEESEVIYNSEMASEESRDSSSMTKSRWFYIYMYHQQGPEQNRDCVATSGKKKSRSHLDIFESLRSAKRWNRTEMYWNGHCRLSSSSERGKTQNDEIKLINRSILIINLILFSFNFLLIHILLFFKLHLSSYFIASS